MDHHKISKLLDDLTVSKFVTRKWIEVNDLSGGQCLVNRNLRFRISMLKLNFCDYSDAYMVVKGRITAEGTNNANKRNKNLIFRNNAPFRLRKSKISNKFIGSAEGLDIPVLSEHFMTSGSLWNYYRDEVNDATNENNAANYKANNNKAKTSRYFQYKTKIIDRTPANNYKLNTEVVVSLKYLSNL